MKKENLITTMDNKTVIDQECPICFDGMNDKNVVITACCKQKIDVFCYYKWAMEKNSCPFCRQPIIEIIHVSSSNEQSNNIENNNDNNNANTIRNQDVSLTIATNNNRINNNRIGNNATIFDQYFNEICLKKKVVIILMCISSFVLGMYLQIKSK